MQAYRGERHAYKKRFGQHFLHDAGIIARIVRAIGPHPGDRMVEIGPGDGALTAPLLRELGKLTVIELDRDLLPRLESLPAQGQSLSIIQADVLKVDFRTLAANMPLRVVGNLPYNISTPILFHCLDHIDTIRDMHFMLQREVVERMAAAPGSKTYGRLSVMLQLACEVESLIDVPARAFEPPPKVESAVVRLRPRPAAERPTQHIDVIARIVRAAFGQRRKTLANALREVANVAEIEAAGIDPRARAEQVAPQGYVALAEVIAGRAGIGDSGFGIRDSKE
jgi:16S rRNA (adenine1518-N6/adenine1519-N6)-dimethyltransferase